MSLAWQTGCYLLYETVGSACDRYLWTSWAVVNTEIILDSNSTVHSYCSSCIHRRCPDWGHCIWQTKWESRKAINLKPSLPMALSNNSLHMLTHECSNQTPRLLPFCTFIFSKKKPWHWDTLGYDLGGKTTDSQDQLSLEQQQNCSSWAEVENNLFPSKRSFRLGS